MSKDINPKLKVGDRVVLISMEDPYSPVTAGNKGTVIGVGHDPWSTEPLYYVKWDNGRTLNLIGDEDIWMKDDSNVNESKEGLINVLSSNDIDPSEMDDLLSQLPDEEVTDLAVRNLERKFLKSGNPRTNARKYLEKLVNSVKNRENIEDENDDYSVEDEFVYGGEEPEKSSIGKKRFKNREKKI